MQITGKITKWGNSLGLRINQRIAEGLGIDSDDKVLLSLNEKSHTLTISAVKKNNKWPFKESDLLYGMNTRNAHSELLTDPVESEINE